MRRRRKPDHRLLSGLLPEDVIRDSVRVTMHGRSGVLIEGQHGVVELGSERLRLRTGCGVLTILGEELRIRELSLDAALVTGRSITTLTYDGRSGG
ncbi:MAG: YabP/YqfC family sporulation protein [Clostridia bacterium]|nr:YabP/YqfC family sporulation protein [Clostridia bacterium]